jgi:hypothetical protein
MRNDPQGRAIQIGRYLNAPAVLNVGPAWTCFFSLDAGVVATTSNHPATAKLDYLHYTDDTNTTLAAVVSSGTGVLFVSEIDTQAPRLRA